MVDKKLSEFSQVTPEEIAKLICLYLDENNAIKNGVVDFATLDALLMHKSGAETITGNKTFSGDAVFAGNATFNQTVNANVSGSSGSCTGNSATATKATQDGSGNNILDTYSTKTELTGKLDLDLGNATNTTKETIVGWGTPDWSAGIDITIPVQATPYICPSDGIYVANFVHNGSSGTACYLYINGIKTANSLSNSSSNNANKSSISVILKKDDSIYFDHAYNSASSLFSSSFYPLKGVNNA